ncbi:hypothetical protein Daesc_000982 [Daldinia eschscholtzii]|uniref:Uncharacterized protein n=1 Tax=Daldinia eschscholtzii TaxID=292717 RepID=A0AAX6N0K9_9PEZI
MAPKEQRNSMEPKVHLGGKDAVRESWPYKMTNLLGLVTKTGHRTKQSKKQMKAAKLQAPNISNRSHRLTR